MTKDNHNKSSESTHQMGQTERCMQHKHAFTLIELLVVISIVVLLIAILLPALAKARRTVQRTVCLTNLRQIAAAEYAYAGDNRGYLTPYNVTPNPRPTGASYDYKYWANLLVIGDYLGAENLPNKWNPQKGLYQTGTLFCPAARFTTRAADGKNTAGDGGSYGVNLTHAFGYAKSPEISTLLRPSQSLLMTETMDLALTDPYTENQRPDYLVCPLDKSWVLSGYNAQAGPRHMDLTINVLYFDGHAQIHPYADVRDNVNDMFAHNSLP
jgi:prepilin-type N-terminal cleavage/methylation domain-containing protein/prepilin-type processing-associated H-X9-DG protein